MEHLSLNDMISLLAQNQEMISSLNLRIVELEHQIQWITPETIVPVVAMIITALFSFCIARYQVRKSYENAEKDRDVTIKLQEKNYSDNLKTLENERNINNIIAFYKVNMEHRLELSKLNETVSHGYSNFNRREFNQRLCSQLREITLFISTYHRIFRISFSQQQLKEFFEVCRILLETIDTIINTRSKLNLPERETGGITTKIVDEFIESYKNDINIIHDNLSNLASDKLIEISLKE